MDENSAFTVTLKAGQGIDAPWVIVKADSIRELQTRLDRLEHSDIPQTVARLSTSLVAAYAHERDR